MEDEKVKCPKCGSTQIHADKKGFSTGKAVVGTVAGGVLVGAAMGSVGSNKIQITCLKCGHIFLPGVKPKQVAKETPSMPTGIAIFLWIILIIAFIWISL